MVPIIAQALPPIPFEAYHLCLFVRNRNLDLAFTSISVFYGEWELFLIYIGWY